MLKIPDTPIFEPDRSDIVNFKNSTLFIISIIVEIVNIAISVFSLKDIDKLYKLIIVLAITILILFVDVIVLYIKDRENHFEKIYLTNMYKFLSENVISNQQTINALKDETKSLSKSSIKKKQS